MDDAELVGGVLFDAKDPDASARILAALLSSEKIDEAIAREAGFEPTLVETLRRYCPRDRQGIERACGRGAAWVRGRRAAARPDSWEVVASIPAATSLPLGLRRTTAETLIGLIAGAGKIIRIVAPYIDRRGLGILSHGLIAASRRDVDIEIFEPPSSASAEDAICRFEADLRITGDPRRLRRVHMVPDAPFSHLKVLIADDAVAYIGSANLTAAALAGGNLELGVIVRGSEVAVIRALLELYRQTPTTVLLNEGHSADGSSSAKQMTFPEGPR